MSPSKPGRNDPCPCGSGKKYKACHAAEDRARASAAAASPAAQPLAAELQAAMALLGDPDTAKLTGALDTLEALLRAWGPAPELRFDGPGFDAHVAKAIGAMGAAIEQDTARAKRELLASTAGALATRSFLDRFRVALLARAAESSRPAEERQALCVAALLTSATPKMGRLRPEDNPAIEVLFDVQFQEWLARQTDVASKLEALVAPLGEAGLSPEAQEALQKARAGDVDALVQHVQADPKLAQRIAQEARERAGRVEAKLREPATPSVFAPEEELWLTVALWEPLAAVKQPGEDASARREAVSRLIQAVKAALDPDFLDGMLGRLRAKSHEAALDEATRAFFADAAIAFEAEPVRLVMAALFTARQEAQGRTAEEMVFLADLKAKAAWTPEELEPYREHLVQQGLGAAAARLQKTQERLRERPVRLPEEEDPKAR
ncbi:SEC-C domain-containing protein [Myxococcaceae bacterium GXIMD 01537]